jgi:hypothetical protein
MVETFPVAFLASYKLNYLLLQRSLHARHLVILLQDTGQWPNRRDREGVDLPVTLRIMVLDMFKLCRRLTERLRVVPVEMPDPFVQVWVSGATEVLLAISVN